MTIERLFLADDGATDLLGARLADELRPGDLLVLSGGLGAGKSALARAIIRTLMDAPALDVPSPSFALVQPYERDAMRVLHADLYRLQAAADVEELGLFDADDAIVLVEWPERAAKLLARAQIAVTLSLPPDGKGRLAEIAR